MSGSPPVRRGRPEAASAVSLLNEAYGGWGDEALYAWKYDDYPGFDPDRCFRIEVDGELAAFRRIFDRSIRGRRDYDLSVLGDTCVAPRHQGRGLYSTLHETTVNAARSTGADCGATFNRRDTLTFAANGNRGWRWRPLPLRVRLLRPSAVLPEYASLALDADGGPTRLLERWGHRVEFRLEDGRLPADRLVSTGSGDPRMSLPVPVPSRLLEVGVGALVGDPVDAVRRGIRRNRGYPSDPGVATAVRDSFAADELSAVAALYEALLARYDVHFRRDVEILGHLLDHPGLVGTVTARRRGDLVGFAPVCLDRTGDVLEAHVLDLVARDGAVAHSLGEAVESMAREHGADAVVAVSERDPGPRWIGVTRQVLMWDDYGTATDVLERGSLFVGLYDVEMG